MYYIMDDKVENKDEKQLEYEEEEEDYEPLVKIMSPAAANWIENGLFKGVLVIDDDALLLYYSKSVFNSKFKVSVNVVDDEDDHKVMFKNTNTNNGKRRRDDNFQVFDVCPICFEPWTSSYGNHQLCSLPCGHMYGSSCIEKWLQQSSSTKCPQCNTACALTDVRPLHATCLSISKHKKASSSPTIWHFPFTKEGYRALKFYVWRRRLVVLRLTAVSSNWHAEVFRRLNDVADRLRFLSERHSELSKYHTSAHGPQADAFLERADALKQRMIPLACRAEALEQRAEALQQRACAFRRLNKAYLACIDYFKEMCKRLDLDAIL